MTETPRALRSAIAFASAVVVACGSSSSPSDAPGASHVVPTVYVCGPSWDDQPACPTQGGVTTTLTVHDPAGGAIRATAATAEYAVFADACPAPEAFLGGALPASVRSQRLGAAASPLDIGELAEAKYGFAVILRDASCRTTAFGCTTADLSHVRTVAVQTAPIVDSTGAPSAVGSCRVGETCNAGQCDPP